MTLSTQVSKLFDDLLYTLFIKIEGQKQSQGLLIGFVFLFCVSDSQILDSGLLKGALQHFPTATQQVCSRHNDDVFVISSVFYSPKV